MREYDEVLYTVSSLSLEYGKIAFKEGLKIGMLLMQEMSEEWLWNIGCVQSCYRATKNRGCS